jgi:dTDP-4-amino-4,6-dideoxygalactose transaminase
MSGYRIPHFGLARQYKNIGEELLDATHRALKDGQLVGGHYTRSFEEWLKHRTKTKYAVTVHSGTQALEIIARYKKSIHVAPRGVIDEIPKIRLPNLTYPATLNAFLNAGWDVELVDTDKYGILDFNKTSSPGSSFDCLVGLYGKKPWEQHRIERSYGIIVDGAQHWLVADGQVGSGMAISFDPTKNLPSSGNGGAIVTNDEQLYLFAATYRDNNKPAFHDVGTNSKMSEQDCAQIMVRAKYIDEWQRRRSEISAYWCHSFKGLPLTCLSDTTAPHAHQKFVLYLPDRNSLHTHLMLDGIDSKVHYEYTLGDLPTAKNLTKPDLLSTSVMLSRGVLSLPIYPELTDIEVDYIADKVHEFYK